MDAPGRYGQTGSAGRWPRASFLVKKQNVWTEPFSHTQEAHTWGISFPASQWAKIYNKLKRWIMTVICEIPDSGQSSAFRWTFNHRREHKGRMKQCWRFNEEGKVASANSRLPLCSLSLLLWDDQREWGWWGSAGLHLAPCWREALSLISAAESTLLCKKVKVGRFGAGTNALKKKV